MPYVGLQVPLADDAAARVVACKCCGGEAVRFGGVDFNRSCEDRRGPPIFEPSGIDVTYHRCVACGFLFTVAFDGFTGEDFGRHVYNDEYVRVDPDFVTLRPEANAQWLATLFAGARDRRFLDYGGGNGLLARLLREGGFARAASYDPFHAEGGGRPGGRFDVVTAFEVVEHSPAPEQTFRDLRWFMDEGGMIIFSTLLQPADITALGTSWWYVGPRNGHVSLYSRPAIDALMRRLGLQWASFSDGVHAAFRRRLPRFAQHLVGEG